MQFYTLRCNVVPKWCRLCRPSLNGPFGTLRSFSHSSSRRSRTSGRHLSNTALSLLSVRLLVLPPLHHPSFSLYYIPSRLSLLWNITPSHDYAQFANCIKQTPLFQSTGCSAWELSVVLRPINTHAPTFVTSTPSIVRHRTIFRSLPASRKSRSVLKVLRKLETKQQEDTLLTSSHAKIRRPLRYQGKHQSVTFSDRKHSST